MSHLVEGKNGLERAVTQKLIKMIFESVFNLESIESAFRRRCVAATFETFLANKGEEENSFCFPAALDEE